MGLCANRSIRFYYIITIHDILVRISRRPSRLFVRRNTDSCWCKLLFYLVTCPIDFQINWWFIKKPLNKFRGVFSLLGDENLSIYKLSNLFHYITSIPDGLISINLFFSRKSRRHHEHKSARSTSSKYPIVMLCTIVSKCIVFVSSHRVIQTKGR